MNILPSAGKHIYLGAQSTERMPEVTVGLYTDVSTMGSFADKESRAAKATVWTDLGLGLFEEALGAGPWLQVGPRGDVDLSLPISVLNSDRTSPVNGLRFSSYTGSTTPERMPHVPRPGDVNLVLTTRQIILPGSPKGVESDVRRGRVADGAAAMFGLVDIERTSNVPLVVARTLAKAIGVRVGEAHGDTSIIQVDPCLFADGEHDLATPVICGNCVPQIRAGADKLRAMSAVAIAAE